MMRLEFVDYKSVAEKILATFFNYKDPVVVIGKYNEMERLLHELIQLDKCTLHNVDFHNPKVDGYQDEYALRLTKFGLVVKPFKQNGKYLVNRSNITFVFDNCNSSVLKNCIDCKIYEIALEDDEPEEKLDIKPSQKEINELYKKCNKTNHCKCDDKCNDKCNKKCESKTVSKENKDSNVDDPVKFLRNLLTDDILEDLYWDVITDLFFR